MEAIEEKPKVKVLCWTAKGGVGKSSIALALSQVLDLQIVTNDKMNAYNLVLKPEQYYLVPDGQEIPYFEDESLIYDFGGFGDSRILDFIKKDKELVILIPFNPDLASWQAALAVYAEIKAYNSNIFFVLNRAKKGDGDVFKQQMKKQKINKPLFELPESKLFQNLFNKGAKISDVKSSKLLSYTYKRVLDQLNELIKELER